VNHPDGPRVMLGDMGLTLLLTPFILTPFIYAYRFAAGRICRYAAAW